MTRSPLPPVPVAVAEPPREAAPPESDSFEHSLVTLPTYRFRVDASTRTSEIKDRFEQQPELPGVIVTEDRLTGMLSRDKLREHLALPFGQELYLKRPVKVLLDAINARPLVIPAEWSVAQATEAALSRTPALRYEPAVIQYGEMDFGLLDVHQLILAQSRLLSRANVEIQRQRDAADAANEAKSQFLANMSHEIRTPLTAILGFAENILEPDLPEADRMTAARTIVRNGNHLLELINDLLDLSKIEAGKMQIERIEFSPVQLAADVLSIMRVRAEARKLPLRLKFISPMPQVIKTDPTRLRQILINLIGNAIKFTDSGFVELQAGLETGGDQPAQIRWSVVDTGIGLDAEQLGRLFTPFMQADNSTARKFGGTGLGLSISRRLARMLGGDVTAASTRGAGSTFSVTVEAGDLTGVPLDLTPDETVIASTHESKVVDSAPAPLVARLLLAEDSPDNQLLIGTVLRKLGASVEVAENGRIAVDLALAAVAAGAPFDVILMDMHMPLLDGYDATRLLREQGYALPIIALTANAMSGEERKCLDAGCDDYATKPINRQKLLGQIRRQVSRTTSTAEPADEGNTIQSPSAAAPAQRPAIDPTIFNEQVALDRAGGDVELFREVCGMVCELVPRMLADLKTSITAGDLVTIKRHAHTLKNTADNAGGQSAREVCYAMEQAAAKGELAAARGLLHSVCDAYDLLLAALRTVVVAEGIASGA